MTSIEKLLEIMKQLRDPQTGCPWDVQQDFSSIAPYTIEEAYEVADAIARDDLEGLRDELGDLLFQVVFHAQMADEAGEFGFDDVATAIVEKMIRRHPHVFGSAEERARDPDPGAWERFKAAERGAKNRAGALADVPIGLPALRRAQKLSKRAATAGFDWPDADSVLLKVQEEQQELAFARDAGDAAATVEEFGDLLFALVNLARHLNVDAEEALAGANRKFERRFEWMESSSAGPLKDLDLNALEALWDTAKSAERDSANGS